MTMDEIISDGTSSNNNLSEYIVPSDVVKESVLNHD
jgi:hypothetical protein